VRRCGRHQRRNEGRRWDDGICAGEQGAGAPLAHILGRRGREVRVAGQSVGQVRESFAKRRGPGGDNFGRAPGASGPGGRGDRAADARLQHEGLADERGCELFGSPTAGVVAALAQETLVLQEVVGQVRQHRVGSQAFLLVVLTLLHPVQFVSVMTLADHPFLLGLDPEVPMRHEAECVDDTAHNNGDRQRGGLTQVVHARVDGRVRAG
jgi:hypothetical protein